MKRALLDQGLAPRAAQILRTSGWDAVHVSDVDLHSADDQAILTFARDSGMCCVTLDHDFHAYLALAQSGRPSVVFLRAEGLNAEAQADLISSVWRDHESALDQGAAISATTTSIRIRPLPLR